jgi:hypothetical protein
MSTPGDISIASLPSLFVRCLVTSIRHDEIFKRIKNNPKNSEKQFTYFFC